MRSTVRSWALGILAVAAFAGSGLDARAQDAAAAPIGDAARGARLGYTCLGCHGVRGGSPIRTPHGDRVNCLQCHVEQDRTATLLTRNSFGGRP